MKKKKEAQPAPHAFIAPKLTRIQLETLITLSVWSDIHADNEATALMIASQVKEEKIDSKKASAFKKSVLLPLVEIGAITMTGDKTTLFKFNAKKVSNSTSLSRLIYCVPSSTDEAISSGVLGGKVWGGDKPAKNGKRDLWVNVRYGRAAGAILKRLLDIGAVGMVQKTPKSPKLYFTPA